MNFLLDTCVIPELVKPIPNTIALDAASSLNRGWKPLQRLMYLPFETIVLLMDGTFPCMVRVVAIIHPNVGAASPPR